MAEPPTPGEVRTVCPHPEAARRTRVETAHAVIDRCAVCGRDVAFEYRHDASQGDEGLRGALDELRRFSEAHHGDQPPHILLHALVVDIPSRIDALYAALAAEEERG